MSWIQSNVNSTVSNNSNNNVGSKNVNILILNSNASRGQKSHVIMTVQKSFQAKNCLLLGTNIDLNLSEKCHMDTKPRTSLSDDCSTATSSGAQFDTDEVTSQLLKVRPFCRDFHCVEITEHVKKVSFSFEEQPSSVVDSVMLLGRNFEREFKVMPLVVFFKCRSCKTMQLLTTTTKPVEISVILKK